MLTNRPTRRLAAVLHGDVVSYSRMMSEDDESALQQLKDARVLLARHINAHDGRIIDAAGDSILAEFSSAQAAVDAAVAAQRDMAERNSALPRQNRLAFRMGINLGDVLLDDGAIYGDGVNIAARIQALAEPGGINISEGVFRLLKQRPPTQFTYLGRREVKNIPDAVGIYQISFGDRPHNGWAARRAALRAAWTKWLRNRQAGMTSLGVAVVLLVMLGLIGVAEFSIPPAVSQYLGEGNVSSEVRWAVDVPMSMGPSLVVVPFESVGGSPTLETYSDGLTLTVTTDLAKMGGLHVTGRMSASRYKGQAIEPRRLRTELGVGLVLQGSLQRMGESVRINVQLIDARTGRHLWAERFDRPMDDAFVAQDQISAQIVDAVRRHISRESGGVMRANSDPFGRAL